MASTDKRTDGEGSSVKTALLMLNPPDVTPPIYQILAKGDEFFSKHMALAFILYSPYLLTCAHITKLT